MDYLPFPAEGVVGRIAACVDAPDRFAGLHGDGFGPRPPSPIGGLHEDDHEDAEDHQDPADLDAGCLATRHRRPVIPRTANPRVDVGIRTHVRYYARPTVRVNKPSTHPPPPRPRP